MSEFYGKHAFMIVLRPKEKPIETSARWTFKNIAKFAHSMQVLHINFKLNLNIYLEYLPISIFLLSL